MSVLTSRFASGPFAIGLFALLAGALLTPAASRAADEPVSLFKIVTARDEVTIGLTGDELAAMGNRPAIDLVAERLARSGYFVSWQYASGRGNDGKVRQVPLRRIAVFAAGVIRVEPFKTDQGIDPPKP